MMPPGTHRAKISRITAKEGSSTLMIVFLGVEGPASNTECVDWVNLDAAEWRLRLIYEAATGNKYPSEGASWDTADLIGQEVMVECEHKVNPNSGEDMARAGKIYPLS